MDLSDAVGHFSDLFDPDVLGWGQWFNASTGQKALYGLPMGRMTYYVHVWKSLLERAGFTLEDVPKEWEAFWSFWCDQVQPAVRKAGRDELGRRPVDGGRGGHPERVLPVPGCQRGGVRTRDGRLVIDDPAIRRKLIAAIDSYTAFYRKGCTPPDAVNWSAGDRNNKAFLAQTVVMTENESLSIPNTLKHEHPDDYYKVPPRSNGHLVHLVRLSNHWRRRPRSSLQGWCRCCGRQGVRALPDRRGLARPLSQLRRRADAAADAELPTSHSGSTRVIHIEWQA